MIKSLELCGFMCVLAVASLPAFAQKKSDKPKVPDEYIRVEVRGKLQHGIMAIGGETTGTEIVVRDIKWELDLGRDKKLPRLAEQLSGKTVVVTGLLDRRKGVEIKERWIVTVESLKAADEADEKKPAGKQKQSRSL